MTTEVPCSRCQLLQAVPGQARVFVCSACGASNAFRTHDVCGVTTVVPEGATAWVCRGCGKSAGTRTGRFAAVTHLAYRLTCLVWLAVILVGIVAVTVVAIRS